MAADDLAMQETRALASMISYTTSREYGCEYSDI